MTPRPFSPFPSLLVLVLLALMASPWCASPARAASSPLPVVVSIPPQKDMLRRIGGEHVSVVTLLKPGADPHTYEPGPAQMRASSSAAIWFTIGVPFEDAWLPRIRDAAGAPTVVSLIAGIQRMPAGDEKPAADQDREQAHDNNDEQDHDGQAHKDSDKHDHEGHAHDEHDDNNGHDEHAHHGHGGHGEDPHVWLSPACVRAMLPRIVEALSARMPEHAETFKTNAELFTAELDALDASLREAFAAVPPERRVFLTFHPTWRYFAREYSLRELSIETEGKEPGPKRMKAIIDTARGHAIRTIFVELQFPKGAARAVAANLDATIVTLDPLAEDLIGMYKDTAAKLLDAFPSQP